VWPRWWKLFEGKVNNTWTLKRRLLEGDVRSMKIWYAGINNYTKIDTKNCARIENYAGTDDGSHYISLITSQC